MLSKSCEGQFGLIRHNRADGQLHVVCQQDDLALAHRICPVPNLSARAEPHPSFLADARILGRDIPCLPWGLPCPTPSHFSEARISGIPDPVLDYYLRCVERNRCGEEEVSKDQMLLFSAAS